jgi:hypothetical protein
MLERVLLEHFFLNILFLLCRDTTCTYFSAPVSVIFSERAMNTQNLVVIGLFFPFFPCGSENGTIGEVDGAELVYIYLAQILIRLSLRCKV